MNRNVRVLASLGLATGGLFGMTGTFVSSPSLRGLAWGIDGVALVMAGALLAVTFHRLGQDLVAAGFLVFTIGEGLILSAVAMDLTTGVPVFGAGISLWAMGMALTGAPRVFPLPVRLLGFVAALLFGLTALRIFAGAMITPLDRPLPFFAFPVLVATMAGWIWSLFRPGFDSAR